MTDASANRGTPLVEMRHMSLSFGGVKAVDDVGIDLYPGEVVGLLGHNGAGKSCLIKMLSGAYRRDAGEIWVAGQKATRSTIPRDGHSIFRGHRDHLPETPGRWQDNHTDAPGNHCFLAAGRR